MRNRRRTGADERAVSELIGFILVFALLISTIVIVYTGGFGALQQTRDAERVNNAERAFDVLATNFEQIARGDAPLRATEIQLSEAKLETTEHRTLSTNATSFDAAQTSGPVPIKFTGGTDTEIVYEAGAVLRTDGDSGVMLRKPDFVFDSKRTVIRYIETRGSDQSVGGSTTVLVRAERRQSSVMGSANNVTDETVTFNLSTTPTRAVVWERYLESEIDWVSDSCSTVAESPDEHTVTCSFPLDDGGSLVVARTRVRVWID